MTLRYFGLSCFGLTWGGTTLVTDPFDPREAGLSLPQQKADMVLFSQPAGLVSDRAKGRVGVSKGRAEAGKVLHNIWEPGEYEIGGIFVRVLPTRGIAVISLGGVNICYIGPVRSIPKSTKFDDLGTINYLIVPVGDGENFPEWKQIGDVVADVDPGVIIPSCYKIVGMKGVYADLKKLEEFAKEIGISSIETEKKLKLQPVVSTDESQYKIAQLELTKS